MFAPVTHRSDDEPTSELPEDYVQVTEDGSIAVFGGEATRRLASRPGEFQLLPSSRGLLVLKQRDHGQDPEAGRPCLLFGEIVPSGSFYEVLQFLGQSRWRGELVVESDDVRRSIFFDEGHVVAAESNSTDESLGEVLCRAGVLTREQVVTCARTKAEGPLRFGEVAVVLGFVEEPRLFREMGRQVDEIFAAAARVRTGVFTFFEGFDDTRLSFRRKQPAMALLLDTIRVIDETDYFRRRIPTAAHVPVRLDSMSPPSDPLGVFAAIDGRRSVEAICSATSADELEVTRTLFELVHTGHVAIAPPPIDASRVVDVYNQAIGFLLRELDAMDEGDGVRDKLARFAADAEYSEFFEGAGPADDGTLDGDKIAEKVATADNPGDAEERVSARLYDYASYALFLARPHLERRDSSRGPEDQGTVSKRFAAMLEPIAPTGEATIAPPPGSMSLPVPSGSQASTLRPVPSRQRLNATTRIPRAQFPGIDPSRTVRIAPISEARIEQARRADQSGIRAAYPPHRPPPDPAAPMPARVEIVSPPTRPSRDAALARAQLLAVICAILAAVAIVFAAIVLALQMR